MMRRYFHIMGVTLAMVLLLSVGAEQAIAQRYPERSMIRKGNREYQSGDFEGSEIRYRRAIEENTQSVEAQNNLGNALYKQERYEEAASQYKGIERLQPTPTQQAESHYNQGNALLRERQLDKAIEQYKQSLRVNPDDREAKFNLAYAKKLKDEQDDKDDDKDKDKNKDKDKQENENQQDQQDENDKDGDDKQDQNQPPPKPDQQPQDEKSQGGLGRKDAEDMLDAMQMNEDKTKEKMDDKKKAVGSARIDKNW